MLMTMMRPAEADDGGFLGVEWSAIALVSVVALVVTVSLVVLYSLGLRLLSVDTFESVGGRNTSAHRPAATIGGDGPASQ